ncbi:glycosyltransferase family 4 protein [Teredinibacter turnerae]|uniref:glycosyltransferase family 4 protein n=1 Tax=Teredinibacter turnerae TaxID=2426 RepID=UPI00036B472B|nr:glycosyltransferase family 4 protein [Teredinibacter turnerae]
MLKIFLKSPIYYHVPIYNLLHTSLGSKLYKVFYFSKVGIEPYMDKEMPNSRRVWATTADLRHEYVFLKTIKISRWDGGFFPRLTPRVWYEVVRSSGSDVLFLQGYSNIDELAALLLSKFSKAKIIFRGEGDPKKNERWFLKTVKKFLLSHVDAIAYSTDSNKAYFEQYNSKCNKFYYPSVSHSIGYITDWSARQNIVVIASRLTVRKRVEIALDIFARCFPDDWRLEIYGEGDEVYLQKLRLRSSENGISGRVRFHGFVSAGEVLEALQRSRFYLITSEYDPSPKALNEALQSGCNVVCSSNVGTASTIKDVDGVYVFDGSFDCYEYEKMKIWISNQNQLCRLPKRDLPTEKNCVEGLLSVIS